MLLAILFSNASETARAVNIQGVGQSTHSLKSLFLNVLCVFHCLCLQNAVRIVRALFEITLRKNNAYMAAMYLKMAKMLELQQWDFYSDMRQFNCFGIETLKHIEYPMLMPDQIRDMDWKELGMNKCNLSK